MITPHGPIEATEIADDAVTTAKILDDAVTTAKILDDNVTTAKILDDNVTTAKILDDAVTLAKISPASLDGTIAKVVAESDVIGGLTSVFMIPIAAGALGDTDVTVTHKVRVIDAYNILRGAGVANTTFQVFNTAAAITDAMAASGIDTTLVRAAEIDDANYEIDAGGTLRVTSATGATQPDALVVVTAVRVS